MKESKFGWKIVSTGNKNVNYPPLEHIYLYGVSRERLSLWNEVTVLSLAGYPGLILNQEKAISTPITLIQF